MNLYHVAQNTVIGYDTYSDFVVAAEDSEAARRVHPQSEWQDDLHWEESRQRWETYPSLDTDEDYYFPGDGPWPRHHKDVTVTFIGEAAPNIKAGMICVSFHAG